MIAIPGRPPSELEKRAARREYVLASGQQELAGAIDRFRAEHGSLPGRIVAGSFSSSGLTASLLERQLMNPTDERGRLDPPSPSKATLGPYLPGGLPVNPVNGLSSVRFAAADAEPSGSAGWIVDPTDGEVRPDIPAARRE